LGEKIATFIMTIATFVSGFVIAYVKGWKLALVITATMPALAISGIIYTNILQNKSKKL
jgi:ATP-binding cassette subfamily B (MDR/TAP) protein 1